MSKRVLSLLTAGLVIFLIAIVGLAVGKKSGSDNLAKIEANKSKLPAERLARALNDEVNATIPAPSTSKRSQGEIFFFDDFEGGVENWQATGTWGHQAGPGGGFLDEDSSDWELATDNFLSATTSWHNTGKTFIQTDMILSPPITVPTEVTVNGVTSPLKLTNLTVNIDWDNVDPANDLFFIYVGKDEALWVQDGSDPGAGASSWVCVIPETGPAVEFARQFLTTPEIDLTAATGPVTLTFLYKSISEPEFDYNKVDVSTDNFVSYKTVFSHAGGIGTGAVETWTMATVDLSAYVGSVIKLRFSHNGDFGFVEPNNIFALDDIDVSDASGSLFSDDGGDTPSSMTAAGFLPGNPLLATLGPGPLPTPTWLTLSGFDVLLGSDGAVQPGDDIRIGLVFVSGTVAPGRGLYIDDVSIEGIGKFEHDVAAVDIEAPFVASVGVPQTFNLTISNEGLNPETGFPWRGRIFNSAGTQVALVVGQVTSEIPVGGTGTFPTVVNWTPQAAGVYSIVANTSLGSDGDRSNDTTNVLTTGGGFYTQFYVAEENVIGAVDLEDAPDDPTAGTLITNGLQVKSNSEPGVVTWQTGEEPFRGTGVRGALVYFDSLGRDQDEELIIPDLDFSYVTSDARLNFYGQSVAGFTYTRISASVSNDGGHSWHDVWERRRGIDPQTGTNYGGPAFLRFLMNPANVDITEHVAGYSNVWVRFRYEALFDESWLVWKIALSGKGLKAAELTGVTDIPNDNGKQVRVSWNASPNDGQLNGVPITEYGVWREVNGGGEAAATVTVNHPRELLQLANTGQVKPGDRVYISTSRQSFDFIASVPAAQQADYNYVAPTLEDGVETTFLISAHTANPEVVAFSNTASGVSTDDLAPGVPLNLSATVRPDPQLAVELSWMESEDEDLQFYTIYKNGEQLGFSAEAAFIDGSVTLGETATYEVSATDFAGNESGRSEPVTVTVVGIDGDVTSAIPTEFALEQNYPNPFNPSTTIKYQTPVNTQVTISIYDLLGRKVRTLVSAEVAAGYYEAKWDATDDAGNPVNSGIYIYRIQTKEFTQSYKMILLK